jgi:nucleotide-binding universal stress UspA family protein
MFKNILIPVSSEFYSKKILERGVFLAEKFKSTVNIIYIIEEKTLDQTDKRSDAFRSDYNIRDTKKDIIGKQKQAADSIIFEDARYLFKNKGIPFVEKTVKGEFSVVIKNEISIKEYDLILMGFEKECTLNYRLLDEMDIPIWVESDSEDKSILAVCSNLAPNQKVPDVSIKLADSLNWDLHMLYVVDMQDNVQVDETGKRSNKRTVKDLTFIGENFIEKMQGKNIDIKLVKGNLEKETLKAAEKNRAGLVIIGREKKRKGMLGLPVKNIKRKIVEKCRYSLLFLN